MSEVRVGGFSFRCGEEKPKSLKGKRGSANIKDACLVCFHLRHNERVRAFEEKEITSRVGSKAKQHVVYR